MSAILNVLRTMCAKGSNSPICEKLGPKGPTQTFTPTIPTRTQAAGPARGSNDSISSQLGELTSRHRVSPFAALTQGVGRVGGPEDLSYWYTYGMGPERQFFSDNTAPTAPAAPGTVTPTVPIGPGDLPTGRRIFTPTDPRMGQSRARGGRIRRGPLSLRY